MKFSVSKDKLLEVSDCYLSNGNTEKAKLVLEQALNTNRHDRKLNYRFAVFLSEHGVSMENIAYYLRRSFSPGDENYDAQLRYARSLFLCKDYEAARKGRRRIGKGDPPWLKKRLTIRKELSAKSSKA